MNDSLRSLPRIVFTRRRPAVLAVAALAVLVYANSVGNSFAYDDSHIIVDNEAIQSLASLPAALLEPYWPEEFGQELGLWRPLTTAALGLQWVLWHGNPAGFHLVNVLLHGAASVLVLLFLAELLPFAAAVAAALIFAVHPVHVEAVANIVGIAEPLAAAFFLAACIFYLRRRGRLRVGDVALLTGLYAAAFLTKESAIALPGALLLLDAATGRLRPRGLGAYLRRRLPLYGVLAAAAALFVAARLSVLGSVAHPFPPLGADVLQDVNRFWTIFSVWPHYVRLLFFPADLSADYAPLVIPLAYGPTLAAVVGIFEPLVFLALAAVIWRGAEPVSPDADSRRTLATGILWFVLTMLPVSNLFFLSGVLLAERTLYTPSVGFVLGIGWLGAHVARRLPAATLAALAVALAAMTVRTVTRNPTWYDTASVMETLIEEHPESGRAQWILGTYYMRSGKPELGKQAYARALETLGYHYPLLIDLGRDYMNAGETEDAERILRRAWYLWPDLARAPFLLTVLYSGQQRWDEARQTALAALNNDPADPVAYHLLANVYAAMDSTGQAIRARRHAIQNGEDEHWQQWYWLAQLLVRDGRPGEAAAVLDSARSRATSQDARRAIDALARSATASPGTF